MNFATLSKNQNEKIPFIGLGLILLFTIFAYFSPIRQSHFLNWDDTIYLTQNAEILSENAWYWIWIDSKMPNPYPLTFSVIRLQYQIFGLNAVAFHGVNLFLHLLNVCLFYKVLQKFGLAPKISLVPIAFYALHPVQVETVMWMSEIKNLLSATFYWISWLCFLSFLETKTKYRYVFYGLSGLTFVFSLLSKSMTITLPVSLLLWVYLFHRKDWKKVFLLLLPFFAISFYSGLASIQSETQYSVLERHQAILDRTLFERIQDAVESFSFYVLRFFYPTDHACVYPKDPLWPPYTWPNYIAILCIIVALFFLLKKTKTPLIPFTFLNYGIVFGPISGFFATSYLPLTTVADRYNYHPLPFLALGITLILFSYSPITIFFRQKMVSTFSFLLLLLVLSRLTHFQARFWTNSVSLWEQASLVNPQETEVFYNLGNAYGERQLWSKAKEAYEQVFFLDSQHSAANTNYGNILVLEGRLKDAIFYYQKALEKSPDLWRAHSSLAQIYHRLNEKEKAILHYQKSLSSEDVDLRNEILYIHLGLLLLEKKRIEDAKFYFQQSLKDSPHPFRASYGLALCEWQENTTQAEHFFQKAIQLVSKMPFKRSASLLKEEQIWLDFSDFYFSQKRYLESIQILKKAILRFPNHLALHKKLAHLLLTCPEQKYRDPKQIQDLLLPVLKTPWLDEEIFDIMIQSYWNQKKILEALQFANEFLQQTQHFPEILKKIRMRYHQLRIGATFFFE